ncbi:hypothetical protein GHK86_00085 [Acidimicrobiaceae bacterium USS-CC1]|uniref:BPL/LPL catalytic domain-containing protein n=1 Tax=Acidiferrimicrobium australe TaxID=2664430 RepID=A0ABW9QN77_9ACTN|nr:hypothetical protein [Acidiferrimicrobium australe]
MTEALRVIDFGTVPPLRSQTLWHAVAEGVGAGGPPTLSFVRTAAPYVSIGFHRSLDELDTDRCARAGWPVYRRVVGGGPVYLDSRQLCFQLSVPAAMVPAARPRALRYLLGPAVAAFRAAGLDAEIDGDGEIVVGDRKVCGHGAAQVGGAVVVVGNLIESFDHRAAASVLKAPDADDAAEALRLMRRYVAWDGGGPPVDATAFAGGAEESYGRTLGLPPRSGGLSVAERSALARLDRRMGSTSWNAARRSAPSPLWRLKVRSGVWLGSIRHSAGKIGVSVVGGRVERLRVWDVTVADPRQLDLETRGLGVGEAARHLRGRGAAGARAAAALVQMGDLTA